MKLDIHTNKGTKAGTTELSDMVFGASYNADLVHQVIVSLQSNQRQGSAHTKNRGEVSGGGIKPWRQKGTGRARHGSSRSPIWRHGGVTHGPRSDKNYDRSINKKVKIKALYCVLSSKFKDGRITGLDDIGLNKISTKTFIQALSGVSKVEGFNTIAMKKSHNSLFIIPKYDENIIKSVRNLVQVEVASAGELNPLEVSKARYIVLVNPEEVNKILEARHFSKESSKTQELSSKEEKKIPNSKSSAFAKATADKKITKKDKKEKTLKKKSASKKMISKKTK